MFLPSLLHTDHPFFHPLFPGRATSLSIVGLDLRYQRMFRHFFGTCSRFFTMGKNVETHIAVFHQGEKQCRPKSSTGADATCDFWVHSRKSQPQHTPSSGTTNTPPA